MLAPDLSPQEIQAAGALFRQHNDYLLGWLRRKLGDTNDAADVAQDTYLRLLQSRRHLVTAESPRALLTHIAKGLVNDLWRRRSLESAYLEALAAAPQDTVPDPEARALVLEALLAIDAMLEQLPAMVRHVFLLSQIEGLTYPQIAAELCISVRTVQNYMLRAIEACYATLYE